MLYMVISPPLGGILVGLTLLLVGCSSYGSEASTPSSGKASPSPGPTFDTATAIVRGDEGSVLIKVEVAQSAEQRSRGLMFRDSLPADAGMVFLFFEPTTRGFFWMKNTTIPLSIAFFGEDGEIVDILDMEPCRADSCPLYTPDSTYFGALEVNQGAFEEWGISEGDVVRMNQ